MVTLEQGKMLKSADGEPLEFSDTAKVNPVVLPAKRRPPLRFAYTRPRRVRRKPNPRRQPK